MPHFPFPSPAQKHLHHTRFLKLLHTNPPIDALSCQAIPINSQLKRPFLSSLPSPQPQVILSSCPVPYLWRSACPSGYLSLSPRPSKMSLSRHSWKFPTQLANGSINYCQLLQRSQAQTAIRHPSGHGDGRHGSCCEGVQFGRGSTAAGGSGTFSAPRDQYHQEGKGPPDRVVPPPPRGLASPR